jgi:hypothetical protein
MNLPLRRKTGLDFDSLVKAKRLAQKMFLSLTLGKQRDYVIVDDFVPYFGSEDKAAEAFGLFDKDNNGDISKLEMRLVVVSTYRERKAIAKSLRDVGHVVGKIDRTLTMLVVILSALIGALTLSEGDPIKYLVPMGSIIVALSVIFGQPCRDFLESAIFLFVTHPFDSGNA